MALEHVFVLDLTGAWAGAYATQILADHGALVIKVEARQRMDVWRYVHLGESHPVKEGPGERPYNRGWLANSVNRNKLGLTLDLANERGRELFCGLVRYADVVAENFTPHVMRQWGLEYQSLQRIRPGLIMLSMPGYGTDGPYSEYGANGGTIEPMSGNTSLLGYEGGPPMNSGVMYPDAVAGMMGAAAVLTALHRRESTGRGVHIDLSQQEAMANTTGYHILSYSLTGEAPGPHGNRHPVFVPHRNYRCQGEEQWVAIAVRNDEDWTRLCEAMGRPELAADGRFATAAARQENRVVVDLIVEGWTRDRPAEKVEQSLLAAGVPVGKARNVAEVVDCAHLRSREFFVYPDHAEIGAKRAAGIPARLSRARGRMHRPVPCLGEHSAEILRRYLGLSDEEIAGLVEQGITGEEAIAREHVKQPVARKPAAAPIAQPEGADQ